MPLLAVLQAAARQAAARGAQQRLAENTASRADIQHKRVRRLQRQQAREFARVTRQQRQDEAAAA